MPARYTMAEKIRRRLDYMRDYMRKARANAVAGATKSHYLPPKPVLDENVHISLSGTSYYRDKRGVALLYVRNYCGPDV